MLNKHHSFQCAFITVPLDRLMVTIASVVLVVSVITPSRLESHLTNSQSSFLEQIDYLRLLWMSMRESSIKEFASNFWSSSPNANNSSNAWQLNFNHGNDNNNNRNNTNRVRLVRLGA